MAGGPRRASTRCALPLRWRRRQVGELVCDRDTPFTADERALLVSIAHHAAVALEHGRAVMRGVLAQEIHHRVKNNLQTVASLLRLQARAQDTTRARRWRIRCIRILAIAAVHEVLTEQRDEVVELRELLERLRAMLVQGLAEGKEVHATSSRSRSPATGQPRWRWCSASCSKTPWSTAAKDRHRAGEETGRSGPDNHR